MNSEKKEIITAFYFPAIFVLLLWIIYFISTKVSFNLSLLSLHPLDFKGLIGIIFAPLIHLDFEHLFNNTTSFIVIGFGLFYLYKKAAISIFFFIYFLSGLWGWFFAREGYHIGASGVIYGMFFFLIVSALLKKERRLIAFSLVITFLYGAIIWGFFPDFFPGKNISWEIHTTGTVAGVIAAFFFKHEGPQRYEPFADEDNAEQDKEEDDDEDAYWKLPNQNKNFN